MIKDTYPCYPSKDKMFFIFRSEGIQGIIAKLIIFTPIGKENEWNLAFGDLKSNDIDDSVITNNQDAMKIIRTVAKATLDFFDAYPTSSLIIKPVDEKRSRLYHSVFRRHFHEIDALFDIIGVKGENIEPYNTFNTYESFRITLKSYIK